MAMKRRKSQFEYEKYYEKKYLKKRWKQVLLVLVLLLLAIAVLISGVRRSNERQKFLEEQSVDFITAVHTDNFIPDSKD